MAFDIAKLNTESGDRLINDYRSNYFDWLKLTKRSHDDGLLSDELALPVLIKGLENLTDMYQDDFMKTLRQRQEYIKQIPFWAPKVYNNNQKVIDLLTQQIQSNSLGDFQELLLWATEKFLTFDDKTKKDFYEINFAQIMKYQQKTSFSKGQNHKQKEYLMCGPKRYELLPLNYHYNLFTKMGLFLKSTSSQEEVREKSVELLSAISEDTKKLFSKEDYLRIQLPQSVLIYSLSEVIEKWKDLDIDSHLNLENVYASRFVHIDRWVTYNIDNFLRCLDMGMRYDIKLVNGELLLNSYLNDQVGSFLSVAKDSLNKTDMQDRKTCINNALRTSEILCQKLEKLAQHQVPIDIDNYTKRIKSLYDSSIIENAEIANATLSLSLAFKNMENPKKVSKRIKI